MTYLLKNGVGKSEIMAQTVASAKKFLLRMGETPGDVQLSHRHRINEAFETYWKSGPDKEEFGRVLNRVILTPEMLWVIGREGEKK